MSLKKYLDQTKFRDSYDTIFGKKDQFKYTENTEELKPRKIKTKHGKIKLSDIKKY